MTMQETKIERRNAQQSPQRAQVQATKETHNDFPSNAAKPGQSPEPGAIHPQSIRVLAHRLWEEAGRPEGQSERFWNEAEQRLFPR